jgi:hypothetical protein
MTVAGNRRKKEMSDPAMNKPTAYFVVFGPAILGALFGIFARILGEPASASFGFGVTITFGGWFLMGLAAIAKGIGDSE